MSRLPLATTAPVGPPAPLLDRFGRVHTDLRVSLGLRGNAPAHAALEAAWRDTIAGRGPGHAIDSPDSRRPERPMSAIGG
ncbi:hypothetical protein [Streptomyces exfoliatus]|uniref:hypothetical protein n=1 Tax=Streptomyces exfoliatus TaxID=1905 RepID=UPI000464E3A9|nr:hypothetical protein [Streptomyces exfoliatus]